MIYVANYAALRVFLFLASLLPIQGRLDMLLRWETAEAIASVTDDPRDQEILGRIARYESGFDPRVAACLRKGDGGRSLGLFQLQPIETRDAARACGSLVQQAELALRYMRRSAEACPGNVGADRLAMFVSGTCARGIREAKHRWGEE